jgi:hypothetical protein
MKSQVRGRARHSVRAAPCRSDRRARSDAPCQRFPDRNAFAILLIIVALSAQTNLGHGATNTVPADLYESSAIPLAECPIDKLVFADLDRLLIKPVLCSDAVFVRRAYLDVIGTLPTAKESRDFIRDSSLDKRSILIDRLLEREEFADYWSMKWGDILRIKAEFPVNLWPNAAQAYHRWVRASIAANKPYDEFVREMLTSSGSNFRVGQVNFYRAIQNRTPEGIAGAVALTFMGTRADAWPTNLLADMAVFFSQIGYKPTGEWKEEHVFWDPLGASKINGSSAPGRATIAAIGVASNNAAQLTLTNECNALPREVSFPDGTKITLPPDQDPREVFADWLINPSNPWFTRAAVNRVWAWIVGRGVIHEPDDIRPDNPPINEPLLKYLETKFVASRYDVKAFYRLVLNSKTYQLSSVPRHHSEQAIARFAQYPLRRLDAEVLIDAINKVTGSSDLYTSPIPEPFTYIPEDKPAIAIADGSITSPFLALFGRSARATGMENERNNRPVAAQWLHLLNSSHIQRKFERGPVLAAIIELKRSEQEIVEELYLTILSRFPTPEEAELVNAHAGSPNGKPGKRRDQWLDVTWALINSTEFLYRH